ncbi:putative M18 family aminopeptidase 2 [Sulfurimicrobium lacus]|uniref:M18 family aminopeptidase n=1 Tax=Sulfurimicrobium lacus TaxID=2715678 RepID=A0A6F8VGG2_9PROT|nr:M18 family aminopeptidase [Sulfurimicrobium lacus]BCB27855.1 putative M18 family aminopeptidase 2 [Sulfurimicrobium lacus]
MPAIAHARTATHELIDFIDASPSPWHAVASAEARLLAQGFTRLEEGARWQLAAGERYYAVRGGASLIAFVLGSRPLAESGFRIVGAHTDSPGLRLKPKAALAGDGLVRLAVEVYGGPILATFADRDLSLAGRVVLRGPAGQETRLLRFEQPLVRLPNLAIHMNREVNEQGLKFNKQTELPLILGLLGEGEDAEANLRKLLADKVQGEAADLLSWELTVHDVQKGCLWGANEEFIASRQLDNLASSYAALIALIATEQPTATCVAAFFDHEEVGSESASGAGGSFVADVLTRIGFQAELDEEDRRRAMARSFFISADMAHAYNPNFPAAYEPGHKVMVNGGPVIKTNVNQRYTTNAETAARFMGLCEKVGVPYQQYAHRSDLGCGSTIGPMVAAQLGVASVDVGSPMWAMHSARESAGVHDHAYMIAALVAAFGS